MDHVIELPDDLVSVLQRSTLQDSTIEDLLRTELQNHCSDLAPILEPYRKDKIRGTIDEDTIKVPEDSLTLNDKTTGVVGFEFTEAAHYGCDDINKVHDNYDDMGFTLDLTRGVLILHAMGEHVRDTDDI